MTHRDTDPRSSLRAVFGVKTEGPTNTALVLNTPSSVLKAQAGTVARGCPLDGVLRDIAAVTARELANEFQAAGLRPADYAHQPEIANMLADRISAMLMKKKTEFAQQLSAYLRMLG